MLNVARRVETGFGIKDSEAGCSREMQVWMVARSRKEEQWAELTR